jgi:hypothetical protein
MQRRFLVGVSPMRRRTHGSEKLSGAVSGTEMGSATLVEKLPFPAGQNLSSGRVDLSACQAGIAVAAGEVHGAQEGE